MPTLICETNRASLRVASVYDSGNRVFFSLAPSPENLLPYLESKNSDWVSKDSVSLYRHLNRQPNNELKLKDDFPSVDQDIKPMEFDEPPHFKLFWADSGNSVALYLNGEPWAFICQETHLGYSKGIISGESGELWDQELFEKTFLK